MTDDVGAAADTTKLFTSILANDIQPIAISTVTQFWKTYHLHTSENK